MFVACAVALAKPVQKDNQNFATIFKEELESLRREMAAQSVELRNAKREIERLTGQADSLTNHQIAQTKGIVEEVLKKENITLQNVAESVDQRVNSLSLALSQEINTLFEKLNHVLNTIISAINPQQKLLSATTSSETKHSDGIAYEVKVGDTLDRIAAKFKVTWDQIRAINLIIDENHLTAGQMLLIPQAK
jgi:LysM repeat protein